MRRLVLVLALAAGCAVGPTYVRPPAPAAPAYKENRDWKPASPRDDALRDDWWQAFDDPQLSALEAQVRVSNQELAAADARFREASALVTSARSAWWPTISIGVSASRSRIPPQAATGRQAGTVNDFSMPVSLAWELDVWGRIRRMVESSERTAQASAADLASTRLSLQAALANDWFQLRALDAERRLLDGAVEAYGRSLTLTQNRVAGGVSSRADVAQAETLLETTRAQAIDLGVARAQLEHAIALLVGTPASSFTIAPAPLAAAPPGIPAGVPSELLERRPDVAAAERRVAAANAQIGVAVAAYYPAVTLSASGGFESSDVSQWLVWPARLWSIGPSVSETVFDGGFRRGQTAEARAAYDETVATYRQTVLAAFQEVEDDLAALRILDEEARVEADAVAAARESVLLTTDRYKAGTVSYLDVVVAQTAALADERTAVELAGRRMASSVLLVQALGGGWNATDLPPGATIAAPP